MKRTIATLIASGLLLMHLTACQVVAVHRHGYWQPPPPPPMVGEQIIIFGHGHHH